MGPIRPNGVALLGVTIFWTVSEFSVVGQLEALWKPWPKRPPSAVPLFHL
jgi:hypothetical protein